MRRARRKTQFYSSLLFILLVGFGVFVVWDNDLLSQKKSPQILISNTIYNNIQSPILLEVKSAKSTIKNVKITLKRDNNDTGLNLLDEKVQDKKELSLQVTLPKTAYKEAVKSYILELEVSEKGFLNFKNKTNKQILVLIDQKSPKINILSHSYHIEKGGAASVVFSSRDENLDEVYIRTKSGKTFKALPFVKEGFYAALIAWDAREEDFEAFVVSNDKAGNTSEQSINYTPLNRKYRTSNISLSDKFLEGKITDLADFYAPKENHLDLLGKFKFVNETLRITNEDLIRKISGEPREERLEDFHLNLFLPLKNAAKVADFADHRFYSYKGEFVSDSYHMGLDLASVAQAPIINSNNAQVVFADENGIYGLNLILYHGFGVYSLYGHCSSKEVSDGEFVEASKVIANTGTSGLALGDHLHFGVLVQGVETRPEQWQDKKWLENNIYKVLREARNKIKSEGV